MISAALLEIVRPLAERFRDDDRQLFLVGGIVRDELLAHGTHAWADIDLATDARPEDTKRLVASLASAVWNQGERFGTIGCRIGAHPFEITTFRGESYQPGSRKPTVVFADALESDLSRRDFTINAIAADAFTGEMHDPFDGRGDLASAVLRTPLGADTSFSDDPLRMLRAARFIARFGLSVVPDIDRAIERHRDRLRIVSSERVRDELHKLLTVEDPRPGLSFIVGHDLLRPWLPDLVLLADVRDPDHGGVDVLAHTFDVVVACANDPVLRLAALLHDIGKAVAFDDHVVRGAGRAGELLVALRHANDDTRDIRALVALHHRVHDHDGPWRPSDVRSLLDDAGDLIDRLVELSAADARARRGDQAVGRRANVAAFMRERSVMGETAADLRPELDGSQIMAILGIGPGRTVGEASGFLRSLRLAEGAIGTERATEALRDWWAARQLDGK